VDKGDVMVMDDGDDVIEDDTVVTVLVDADVDDVSEDMDVTGTGVRSLGSTVGTFTTSFWGV
jgi:hypothetical protein